MKPLCLPSGSDLSGVSFVPIHLATAAAFVVLAWSIGGLLLSTRPTRIAFLSGLTDGRQKLCADAFATAWMVATLLGVCGCNQLLLVLVRYGAPYALTTAASVARGSVVVVCAIQVWRIWRRVAR